MIRLLLVRLIVVFALAAPAMMPVMASESGDVLLGAAAAGDREMVQAIIAYGVDIDATDEGGETALFKAVRNNRLGIIDLLVAAGADVERRDHRRGNTALIKFISSRPG